MSQNPTPAQLQALLRYAGKRLGTTPEQLLQAVHNGGLDALARQLSPEDAARLQQMTGDRALAEHWLRSPAAQQLLKQVLKEPTN